MNIYEVFINKTIKFWINQGTCTLHFLFPLCSEIASWPNSSLKAYKHYPEIHKTLSIVKKNPSTKRHSDIREEQELKISAYGQPAHHQCPLRKIYMYI